MFLNIVIIVVIELNVYCIFIVVIGINIWRIILREWKVSLIWIYLIVIWFVWGYIESNSMTIEFGREEVFVFVIWCLFLVFFLGILGLKLKLIL